MKLAGKLLSIGAIGVPVGGTLMIAGQPGGILNPLPQPKSMQEAIARNIYYDQRKYLDMNFGIPGLMSKNPYDRQLNYRSIYDDYVRNRGY